MTDLNFIKNIPPDRKDIPEFKIFEFLRSLDPLVKSYSSDVKNKHKYYLAYQRFHEYLLALEGRKYELETALNDFNDCKKLSDDENKLIGKESAKLKEGEFITISTNDYSFRQMQLVFRIESLHQQIYSTLSCFKLLLSFIMPQSVFSQMPKNSMKKFIKFFKGTNLKDSLHEHLEILERSIYFRSNFFDHPELHASHTWLTWGTENDIYICYYIPLFDALEIKNFHEKHPGIALPPFEEKSFYVSPETKKTYNLMKEFVYEVLKNAKSITYNKK